MASVPRDETSSYLCDVFDLLHLDRGAAAGASNRRAPCVHQIIVTPVGQLAIDSLSMVDLFGQVPFRGGRVTRGHAAARSATCTQVLLQTHLQDEEVQKLCRRLRLRRRAEKSLSGVFWAWKLVLVTMLTVLIGYTACTAFARPLVVQVFASAYTLSWAHIIQQA